MPVLARDITAGDLAMDSPDPGEGYRPEHVIGPVGSSVTVIDERALIDNDEWVEVTGFANDWTAAGFVHRDALA